MPMMTLEIPFNGELHRKLLARLRSRISMAKRGQRDQHEKWRKAEETILAYVPETDVDARRRQQREEQGLPKYTTLKLPYSYALLMAAHTYWTSVFFAREPVHQIRGRHGESERQVQAVEALLDYQISVGGALGPYYVWLYDAGKYGCGVLGEYWDREIIRYSSIEENPEGGKAQVSRELEGFVGNRMYNVAPYDFFPDPRVTVGNFQKGEFILISKRISWNDILRRDRDGYFTNTEHLKSHRGSHETGGKEYSQLERPEEKDWIYEDEQTKHPAVVRCWECYVELIPNEWGLGSGDYPEKWVLTLTDDETVIIGCQPLGYAHGKFPFDVLESEVEAYGSWNRGLPEIIEPIQNTMDWLLNTHFYNVRTALNNLFLADPTRVVMKDLQRGDPGGIIRIKPEAYGTDIRGFFQQIPVADVTRGHVDDLQLMLGIGERITGINDQILGAIGGGGRKTATEVRTSTGFGVNRLKTVAEYMSATGFAPHAQKLIQQSQQFYSAERKLRIVGDLSREAGAGFMQVAPDDIAGFYDLVPVDGTLPIDRMALANLWKEIMVALRNFPDVLMRYDMGRIFGHVAVLGGIRNLNQFQKPPQMQVVPDEALAMEAQRGNVVPLQSDSRLTGMSPEGMLNRPNLGVS